MRFLVFVTLVACALPAALIAGHRSSKTSEADGVVLVETVKAGQLLDVDLVTGGAIRIRGVNGSEVRIECPSLEDDCPDAELSFTRTPRGVLLKTEYEKGTGNTHDCSLDFEIRVPRRFDVRIRSAGGQVWISGMKGRIDGQTGGGQLQLREVEGEVSLTTGGGQIFVADADLDGRLSTGGGQVRFENVVGNVSARSGSQQGVVRGKPRR